MFRRIFSGFLIIIFLFSTFSLTANSIGVSAQSSVLLNANTLSVYYDKNAHKQLPMASTTKIMTAVILCENVRLDEVIRVTYEMIAVEGSSMGLLEGDRITYYGLLCGMLLASGNDAANSAAISFAGSAKNFAELMNKKAKEIGMNNTNFVTASGLDDENHYSTAYDMALLASYALNNQIIRDIVSQKSITIEFGNPVHKQSIRNHNRLLSIYKDAIGVKTGFTKKSGRCLVSAAERDGVTLICVTLNAPDDWDDHCNLFEYGFSLFKNYDVSKIVQLKDIDLVGANSNNARLKIYEKKIKLTENDIKRIKYKAYLPRYIYATSNSEKVGRVDYYINDRYIGSSDVLVGNDFRVVKFNQSFSYRFWNNFFNLIRV